MTIEIFFTKKFIKRFNDLIRIQEKANKIKFQLITNSSDSDLVLESLRDHDALREVFNERKYWWMNKMKRINSYGGTEKG